MQSIDVLQLKRGDRIKITSDVHIIAQFYDGTQKRRLRQGDIVTVRSVILGIPTGDIAVVYECKGATLSANETDDGLARSDADLIYATCSQPLMIVEFEVDCFAISPVSKTDICICSRTTLMQSGCTCGHIKSRRSKMLI